MNETVHQISYIFTVRTFEETCEKIQLLAKENVGAIELCGVFGEEKAKIIRELTHNKIAVGYVTYNSEQDELFRRFFSK